MGIKVDIDKSISLYKSKGGKIAFENDLKKTLGYVANDNRINDVRELAYLLATAQVEGEYSLTRWEADYICKDSSGKRMTGRSYFGTLPDNKPCKSALDYYCGTQKKASYCYGDKAESREIVFDKRGLPYFGRGLIGVTWSDNYLKRGQSIGLGDALLKDPDLIIKKPKISYDVAVDFLANLKKGSNKKSTFDLVKEGDLVGARRWVNGCSREKCKPDAEQHYNRWMEVFNDKQVNLKKTKGVSPQESNVNIAKGSSGKGLKALGFGIIFLSVVGFAYGLYYFSRTKK
jgi:predicted chitinase